MDYTEYLRRLPKVELHCHVEGTLRPQTVADLATKHDITLPTTDVDRIYDYETIYEFLEIFRLVNSTVIDQADFARIVYESLEDGAKSGNLKYREMFFNPTLHTTRGVAMSTIIDGLIDGCRSAEEDFGVRCRLIADVYRQDSPAVALQMTQEVLANRRDEADRARHGRGRGARSAGAVLRGVPARGRVGSAPHESRGRGRTAQEHLDASRPARLRADRSRLPHPGRRRGGRALRRGRHPLHVLPHFDRGRVRLARSHDAPDQRDDEGGPARPPQLRRPDDVPHRHRQGVRRLRRAERVSARGREAPRAQRGRRARGSTRARRPRCTACSTTRSTRSTRNSRSDRRRVGTRTPAPARLACGGPQLRGHRRPPCGPPAR